MLQTSERTYLIESFVRPLLEFARPHRLALMVGIFFMLVETGVSLAVPWLGGRFVNDFLGGNRPSMVTILMLIAGLFTAQALLRVASGYVFAKRAALILADVRVRLYEHIQSLPVAFFQQRQQGALLSILSNDVAVISYYLSGTLINVVPMLMAVIGSVVFMLTIDTTLAIVATLAIPFFTR